MEKKIFEKESKLLKLSVKMREESDEITLLKTRDMSLIDKSDTLEKGQIMVIIHVIWILDKLLWYIELGFSKGETQAYKKVSIATRQGNLYNIYNMKIKVQEVWLIQAYNMS